MSLSIRLTLAGAVLVHVSFCPKPAAAQGYPKTAPAAGPLKPANFPPFKEARLENGLRLVVVERPGTPVVSLSLSVPAGQAYDPDGKNGLSQLVSAVLDKGAGSRSADEVAATLNRLGASIGVGVDSDYLSVVGTSLTPAFPQLFQIFADVVAKPAFPEKEVELARSNMLAGLQMVMNQPSTMAQLTLARTIYPGHPYGRAPLPSTVQSLTRKDLVDFHSRTFRPDGALLVVAGDITLAAATALAERALSDWKGKVSVGEVTAVSGGPSKFEILLINRPGSVQSTLLYGNVTAVPTDPSRAGSVVFERIIGGGPTSRLFNTLREKHGWTYGVQTKVNWPLGLGYTSTSTDVRTEVTDSAAAMLMSELRRIRIEPVSAKELNEAKDALTGIFPLQVQTAAQVAVQVRSIKLQRLPDSWLPTYRTKIAAVTAADVQRAASKYVRPDNGVLVVVGDAPKIIAGLRKIAPVKVIDISGKEIDLLEK